MAFLPIMRLVLSLFPAARPFASKAIGFCNAGFLQASIRRLRIVSRSPFSLRP
jgi:hypothetical protein